MSLQTSPYKPPEQKWTNFSTNTDFLHLIGPNGTILGGIDSNGNLQGNLGGGVATKTLYVDGNRLDSYTPNGSVLLPFKTIMAAVNQIITNGDNGTFTYMIRVSAGVYTESIVLSNTALHSLIFVGWGVVLDSSQVANGHGIEVINNDNLVSLTFVGFIFNNGANAGSDMNSYVLKSSTNNTNFLMGQVNGGSIQSQAAGFWLLDCHFDTTTFGMTIENAGSVLIQGCELSSVPFTFNNVGGNGALAAAVFLNCNTGGNAQGITANTNNSNPVPNGFSGSTFIAIEYCNAIGMPINSNAGSIISLTYSITQALITANGTVSMLFSKAVAGVTVNSGGTLNARSSDITPPFTVNAGGTYSSYSSIFSTGSALFSHAAPTSLPSTVGIGNGTATTATAGAQTLPANPAGFWVINVNGTTQKIPYYNN